MNIEIFKKCSMTLFMEEHVGVSVLRVKPKKAPTKKAVTTKRESTPKKETSAKKSDPPKGEVTPKKEPQDEGVKAIGLSSGASTPTPKDNPTESTPTKVKADGPTANSSSSTPQKANPVTPTKDESGETTTPKRRGRPPGSGSKKSAEKAAPALPADPNILQQLNAAMKQKKTIWISYDGGTNPGVPRAISPLHWIRTDALFKAVCSQSRTEKFFNAPKVLEIREEKWETGRPVTSNPSDEDKTEVE